MNQGKMTSYVKSGYLEIILEPMLSGKTSRLVEIYKQCNFCNISVAVINHCIDNRYDDELLSTHDKIKIPCIKTEKLFDVWTDCINMEEEVADVPRTKEKIKVASSEVILINKGQFFPDLEDFVKRLLSHSKQVYICSNFKGKKFGQMLDLIPLCDKIHKLTSLCSSYDKSRYLEIILGPMFSGKTSRLVEIYKQCNFCNISVAVINHCIDNRYDDELLSTHDKIKIPCIKTEKLFDVWTDCINMEVILINEGQFFSDLEDFVRRLLSHNKQVYICGLDGDFERKKFGQILDLVPLCDKIHKLTSLCSVCKNGNKGIFSMRLTSEKEQTVVGSDNYITVCRSCYDKR